MDSDKELEHQRYNERAQYLLDNGAEVTSGPIPLLLQPPYIFYNTCIESNVCRKHQVLEIGAGTGAFTEVLLHTGASVCASDISEASLEVINGKFGKYDNLYVKVADMESLPFEDEEFDVVTSAGSLSYGDNLLVMNEVYRVLKPGGLFIVVDSLNNNPIYRFNRYIHYLKGNRSKSTILRMPTIRLIRNYNERFGHTQVKYFGAVTYLAPLLNSLLSEKIFYKLSNWIDKVLKIKRSAFKFVMITEKNEK